MIRQTGNHHRIASRYVIVLLLVMLTTSLLRPSDLAAQQQAWEFAPYKVKIWLATETAGELNRRVQESLSFELLQRLEAFIGAPWDAEIVEPPAGLRSSMLIDPALVTSEVIATVAPDSLENDKIILLTVRVSPREFTIDARELDCRTRLFGPPVQRIVRQPDLLGIVCFDAVSDSFRAVTRLELGQPRSAIVRIRAGGLVRGVKSSPCYVGSDDVLLPIQRNNDRTGLPRLIIPIEWTFLQVQTPDETNEYLMTCRVWSGKPNPVTGKISPRKERYALKVKPTAETTTLRVLNRVVRRGDEAYPMPGLEVYAKAPQPDPPPEAEVEPPAAEPVPSEGATDGEERRKEETSESEGEKEKTPPAAPKPAPPKVQGEPAELLGRTDWNGSLEIVQSESPLRILYLKNGAQLLARLPIVPGLDSVLIASVPDDAARLAAEGFVKGIEGQLMDLEAQRQILKARFMLRIEASEKLNGEEKVAKLKEAQDLLEEIKQLQTRADLREQIRIQRDQQDEAPVKSVQARIDRMYAKLIETLGKHLSPGMVNELTGILNDSRRGQPATATTARAE